MVTADHNLCFLQEVESIVASVTVSLCCVGVEGVLKLRNVELHPINFAATDSCLYMHALTHSYAYSPCAHTLMSFFMLSPHTGVVEQREGYILKCPKSLLPPHHQNTLTVKKFY